VLQPSTIQLLRIPFSFFLLPVYLFALSQVPDVNWIHALQVFIILHLLVYPSSNGYNSFMDRDETPVGGLEKPMAPTRELFQVSVGLDALALLWSGWISMPFFLCLFGYILASRAYSYRGIRLKKYPIVGYLTVCLFQGAVTYFMVFHACSSSKTLQVPVTALLGASLLMGSFYPLTQVYQHEADRKDGVKTISLLLGIRGTFQYTAIVYSIAMGVLFLYFKEQQQEKLFLLMALLLLPVLVYFFYWANKVWKNPAAADFRHTMRMNWLASACSNLVFSLLILIRYFE
jgi:1,4-dihydroxy-2-naphthoate polyprenyltransferase